MTEKLDAGTGGSIEALLDDAEILLSNIESFLKHCDWNDRASEETAGDHLQASRELRERLSAALLTRRDQPEQDEPYFVEVDSNGCERCNAGKTWTVVGPDGCAASQSWEQEEDAEAFADAMNAAYWMGKGTRRDAPQEPPVDTYTPILWVSMSDDQKYAEYLRLRKLVGRDAPPAVNEDEDDHTRVDNGIGSRTTGSTATTNEVIRD